VLYCPSAQSERTLRDLLSTALITPTLDAPVYFVGGKTVALADATHGFSARHACDFDHLTNLVG
jgi:hypothetical protein